MAEDYDTAVADLYGWGEAQLGDDDPAPVVASGETDWAAIVASALGGTADIIKAATGGASPPKGGAPQLDPFGAKATAGGVPVWVWGAVALGGLVLLSRRKR